MIRKSKIIAGLKDAVRHSRGENVPGARTHLVRVPLVPNARTIAAMRESRRGRKRYPDMKALLADLNDEKPKRKPSKAYTKISEGLNEVLAIARGESRPDYLLEYDGDLTRFEVIDETGRVYARSGVSVQMSYQDGGRTFKAFIKPLSKEALAWKRMKPEVIEVSKKNWDALQDALKNPAPPNAALKRLMRKKAPWDRPEKRKGKKP